MPDGRFGDIEHPEGGGRFGDIEHSSLSSSGGSEATVIVDPEGAGLKIAQGGSEATVNISSEGAGVSAAPVLSAPRPTAFAVGQASLAYETDKAGGTAYLVVTASSTQPSAAQIIAGQDHTGSAAEQSASHTPTVGLNTFANQAVGAGYWYGHIVQVDTDDQESNRVSTVEFRVAGDSDGPDEWSGPVTARSEDSALPEEAAADDVAYYDRIYGSGVEVIVGTGSTSATSSSWSVGAQIWDWSLNGGLGGLSAVNEEAWTPQDGSEAEVAVSAEGAGTKLAQGGADASVVVSAEGAGLAGSEVTGGSEVTVQIDAEGSGAKIALGASEVGVTVDSEGAGFKVGAGGSDASVAVSGEGAGTKLAQGGAEASVVVEPEGQGSKAVSGASEAGVAVSAEGDGLQVTPGEGGSDAVVRISAQGAGFRVAQGGSTAEVQVAPEGSGSKTGLGAAEVQIDVSGEGQGSALKSGGSESNVLVFPETAARKSVQSGSEATVVISTNVVPIAGRLMVKRIRIVPALSARKVSIG